MQDDSKVENNAHGNQEAHSTAEDIGERSSEKCTKECALRHKKSINGLHMDAMRPTADKIDTMRESSLGVRFPSGAVANRAFQ